MQAETAAGLRGEVERLTSELKTSETDRASMKEELDKLKHEIASLRQPTAVYDLGKPSPTENQAEVYVLFQRVLNSISTLGGVT